ncbi:hypothetical protein FS837_011412 [Tulasnella sp. UAMH 9824]|nr:hypothetical protein FS837_011412 [Tulasnella sp. UAMH 9824]
MATTTTHPQRQDSTYDTKEKDSIEQIERHPQHPEIIVDEKVHDPGARFAAAKIAGKLDPWSRASFTIYACALMAFLCSMGNGYDGSLMTAINAMEYYQKQFNSGRLGSKTGIIFSIYTVGQMAGFGRRGGMFAGAWGIVVGVAVIASSHTRAQFIGGRFLLGFGIAIATTGAPTYILECSPPQWRGRLTSLYNTGWFGGSIPAAGITLGTSAIKSNWSWKIPLILQAVPASLVISFVWFLPESPRFLYQNGRKEEAYDFLTKYHGNGDRNNPIVQLEIDEFEEAIRLDGSDKRWWDYSDLVKTKNARWRSLMVFLMGLFGQMSGNGLGYFNVDIYKSLGYNTHMQFILNLVNSLVQAVTAWVAVSLTDRMPRRKVLVTGTALCCLMLAANAGFSAKWATYGATNKNLNVGRAGAASFFLFNSAYAFTYTPLQSLYPAECLENTARAKGVAMKIFVISCTSFINLLCTPIALQNIQWRFILVFVGWDAFETIIWYFFAVETQGRTLEELDVIFSSPNPVAASKQKSLAIVDEEHGVVRVVAAK